jgi:uncharacterized membrane protein YdjX (TVP38/TMEM64 family)
MNNQSSENPLLNWDSMRRYVYDHRQQILRQMRIVIPYLMIYALVIFLLGYFDITAEKVRESFAGLGPILLPAFIAAQMVASLTPLPDLPFTAAGVLFFHPLISFVVILLGMWFATFINFMIARRLGREYILRKYPQSSEWLDQFAGKHGFETIIVARSFTFVTFDLVAYTAGVSSISLRTYMGASFISFLPIALNSTLVGLALTSGNIGRTFILAVLSAVIAIALGWTAKKYRLALEVRAANAKS